MSFLSLRMELSNKTVTVWDRNKTKQLWKNNSQHTIGKYTSFIVAKSEHSIQKSSSGSDLQILVEEVNHKKPRLWMRLHQWEQHTPTKHVWNSMKPSQGRFHALRCNGYMVFTPYLYQPLVGWCWQYNASHIYFPETLSSTHTELGWPRIPGQLVKSVPMGTKPHIPDWQAREYKVYDGKWQEHIFAHIIREGKCQTVHMNIHTTKVTKSKGCTIAMQTKHRTKNKITMCYIYLLLLAGHVHVGSEHRTKDPVKLWNISWRQDSGDQKYHTQ